MSTRLQIAHRAAEDPPLPPLARGLVPATMTTAVSDFFKSSGVLYVFIATVVVGPILSMDRTVLIKGFAKIVVPLAVGSVVAITVGMTVRSLRGLGTRNTLQLWGFPAPVVMLGLAVAFRLLHGITPRIQAGSYTVYKFCPTAIAYPMLFAFGIVLTPWDKLIEGFAPANLLTIVSTVLAMTLSGFFTARLVNLYPVESAIVTSTPSGMGGADGIAILTASSRMMLMPFAQVARRIGGGITVALTLITMPVLA